MTYFIHVFYTAYTYQYNNFSIYSYVIINYMSIHTYCIYVENCYNAVMDVLSDLHIHTITKCDDLQELTYSMALQKSNNRNILAIFGCSYGYWDPSITCYGYQNDDDDNKKKNKNGGDDDYNYVYYNNIDNDVDGGDDYDDTDNVDKYITSNEYACYDTKRGLDTTTPWNKLNHFLGELDVNKHYSSFYYYYYFINSAITFSNMIKFIQYAFVYPILVVITMIYFMTSTTCLPF